jgi:hypothetical protein
MADETPEAPEKAAEKPADKAPETPAAKAVAKSAAKGPAPGSDVTRVALLCFMGVVFMNGVFFILSYAYYNAHKIAAPGVGDFVDLDAREKAREAFLVLSLITGAAVFIATRIPKEMGHGLSTLLGLCALAGSYGAFSKSMPLVMGVTLLVVGILMPTLAFFSWKGSRAAWSFLIALVAVFGGVTLFGAPKVRALLGLGLWTAMIFPALKIVTVFALGALRRDYRART